MEEVNSTAAPPLSPATEIRPLHPAARKAFLGLCTAVRDLRPHLLQVMQEEDFRNCEASRKMQKQAELVSTGYKQLAKDLTCRVGGSPSGLNFITYLSKKPVYYGISKQEVLSRKVPKKRVPKNIF
ncbi:uncharacterized protein LOC114185871 [Vigna unguiculata]|uniref:Uncharacterized protein n=1 Tax=Vigna unguiculata TaxID=3917 RepID=A0A4D6NEJ6_VIGUN|nr:uncharacterized protein LOC114185871 [Vigna unguiculata]QCE12303.1 hypothetical protein DEO72_LG10g3545 [Vigna unguiculata]